MVKKTIRISISKDSYINFKQVMKKKGFKEGSRHDEIFIKYCILNVMKDAVSKEHRKQVLKEIKAIKDYEAKK